MISTASVIVRSWPVRRRWLYLARFGSICGVLTCRLYIRPRDQDVTSFRSPVITSPPQLSLELTAYHREQRPLVAVRDDERITARASTLSSTHPTLSDASNSQANPVPTAPIF